MATKPFKSILRQQWKKKAEVYNKMKASKTEKASFTLLGKLYIGMVCGHFAQCSDVAAEQMLVSGSILFAVCGQDWPSFAQRMGQLFI